MSAYPCEDCSTVWESRRAADECAILDAAETRAARRAPLVRRDNGIVRAYD